MWQNTLFVVDRTLNLDSMAFRIAVTEVIKNNGNLNFICVLPDIKPLHYSNSPETLEEIRTALVRSVTNELEEKLSNRAPALSCKLKVVIGKQFLEVVNEVLRKGYGLVVKQSENPSWLQSIFGSNDLHLLRKCPCPVLLLKDTTSDGFSRIATAIDFSDDAVEIELNNELAKTSLKLASDFNASVDIVSAYDSSIADFTSIWTNDPDKFEKEYVESEYKRLQFSSDYLIKELHEKELKLDTNLKIQKHIVHGEAVEVIPAKVKELEIDLLVMGTIGRSGIQGMLIGNTAESILLQLDCSVLALKPSDYVSPIARPM